MVLKRIKSYGNLVMFSHTIFSLPFGLMGMVWAQGGIPPLRTFVFILLALSGARNGANAFNRIADRKIDARNQRTADRPLQTGQVKLWEAWAITIIGFAVMAVAAYQLNLLCLILLPFAIGIFVVYSYTKRFTWLCHWVLGAACGGAPVGAWIAVTGEIALAPLVLGGAVCLWVAGFDILYATQDIAFDRKERLHSVPARFGLRGGQWIALASHVGAVVLLLAFPLFYPCGWLYLVGIAVVAALLCVEHLSLRPDNQKRMNFVSYHINQIVGIVFFAFALLDFFVGGGAVWTLSW